MHSSQTTEVQKLMSTKNYQPKVTVDERGCQTHVLSIGQAVPQAFTNLVTMDRGDGVKAARDVVRIAVPVQPAPRAEELATPIWR